MLVLSRGPGQSLVLDFSAIDPDMPIGDLFEGHSFRDRCIHLRILECDPHMMRIGIDAPRSVRIDRPDRKFRARGARR